MQELKREGLEAYDVSASLVGHFAHCLVHSTVEGLTQHGKSGLFSPLSSL
jgi:hypothetical protein